MRIIDADKLPVIRTFALVNDEKTEGGFAFAPIYCVMKGDLDNAPTVEQTIITEFKGCDNCELERPQGKWLSLTPPDMRTDTNDYFKACDKCNHAARFISADLPYKFCPNCGAKMQNGGATDEP